MENSQEAKPKIKIVNVSQQGYCRLYFVNRKS
jgi:hypothetical protein